MSEDYQEKITEITNKFIAKNWFDETKMARKQITRTLSTFEFFGNAYSNLLSKRQVPINDELAKVLNQEDPDSHYDKEYVDGVRDPNWEEEQAIPLDEYLFKLSERIKQYASILGDVLNLQICAFAEEGTYAKITTLESDKEYYSRLTQMFSQHEKREKAAAEQAERQRKLRLQREEELKKKAAKKEKAAESRKKNKMKMLEKLAKEAGLTLVPADDV